MAIINLYVASVEPRRRNSEQYTVSCRKRKLKNICLGYRVTYAMESNAAAGEQLETYAMESIAAPGKQLETYAMESIAALRAILMLFLL